MCEKDDVGTKRSSWEIESLGEPWVAVKGLLVWLLLLVLTFRAI